MSSAIDMPLSAIVAQRRATAAAPGARKAKGQKKSDGKQNKPSAKFSAQQGGKGKSNGKGSKPVGPKSQAARAAGQDKDASRKRKSLDMAK